MGTRRSISLLLGCLLALSGAASTVTATPFTTDGAWSWFSDPRAIHYQGVYDQTYVGWVTRGGDVVIGSYRHADGARATFTLHPALQADDHAAPSILVRSDGRLMVFYSAHNGPSLFYRESVIREDITAWGPEQRVGVNTAGSMGYTYSNPFQLTGEQGKIYLFWRGANFEPTLATSTDGGLTWSIARTVINNPHQRPYVKYASDGAAKIHLAFTDGHPAEFSNNSIHYASYQDGAYYRADGSLITTSTSLPFAPGQADLVYDAAAGGARAWVWDVATDPAGHPVIVYATFPTTLTHFYRYARWSGTAWLNYTITAAGGYIDGPSEPYYSGGIELDHANPSIVYLSRQVNGIHQIEKWTTPDGGASWTAVPLTSGSSKKNVRPVVPWGSTSSAMNVIWMYGDYQYFTSFNMALDVYPGMAARN